MRSRSSRTFTTRLPPQRADQLEAAIEETGWTQSEFLCTAIEYYIRRNPDYIAALCTDDSVLGFLLNMERDLDA